MKKIIIIVALVVVCSISMFSQTTKNEEVINELKSQITQIQKIREDVIASKETYSAEEVVIVWNIALAYAGAYLDVAIDLDSLTKEHVDHLKEEGNLLKEYDDILKEYNNLVDKYNKLLEECDK